jgi:hypothetical protein
MTEIIYKSVPLPINYAKNNHGFSNSNNDSNKYLFELIIKGKKIGKKYFRNLENTKYSHFIKIDHEIKLSDITSYKASLKIFPDDKEITYELEGNIEKDFSNSTQYTDNLYIEFTRNDNDYAICSCFYTGFDNNKIFASPPN